MGHTAGDSKHPAAHGAFATATVVVCTAVWLSADLRAQRRPDVPINVLPAALATTIEEFAGYNVNVLYARVVHVFNSRVIAIDTATAIRPVGGTRDRVLVFIGSGDLNVTASSLVGATVRVSGRARTLLGMQVSREVPWPAELSRGTIKHLEIRAAVLATSVRTADGVELTSPRVDPQQ